MTTITMRKTLVLGLAGAALSMMGCASGERHSPTMGYGRIGIQGNFTRTDFEIVGPVQGMATKKSYLCGLVSVVDDSKYSVLGIKFYEDNYTVQKDTFQSLMPVSTGERAYFKALAATPDADAVLEKTAYESKFRIPGIYSRTETIYTGKGVKIKADPSAGAAVPPARLP